jgi:curved DNA-binding protein
MPDPGGRPGDLYAEVKIMVPPRLTDRERELFTELAAVSTFDPRGTGSDRPRGSR